MGDSRRCGQPVKPGEHHRPSWDGPNRVKLSTCGDAFSSAVLAGKRGLVTMALCEDLQALGYENPFTFRYGPCDVCGRGTTTAKADGF